MDHCIEPADQKLEEASTRFYRAGYTEKEILDADLHTNELLRRLFHEEGVIVYDPKAVRHECRCSEQKVRDVIKSLSEDDRQHAAQDGIIEMTCEFCNKTYSIEI